MHAFLPPSSAGVWVHCSAFPTLNVMHPSEPTQASIEGEAAHELAAAMVLAYQAGQALPPRAGTASNGTPINPEIYAGAKLYADHVAFIMNDTEVYGGNCMGIEEKLPPIQRINVQNWGTPDLWLYAPKYHRLYIWDFKFGFLSISALKNWQLIDYTAGVVERLEAMGVQTHNLGVTHFVIQPRDFTTSQHIKRADMMLDDLRGEFNQLEYAAHMATNGDSQAVTGPHCFYCPARLNCAAHQKAGARISDYAQGLQVVELDNTQLGLELTWLREAYKFLQGRLDALEEEALLKVKRGEVVAGFVGESKPARLVWQGDPNEILAVGDVLGVPLTAPAKPITPTQALELPAVKNSESAIKAIKGMSFRPRGDTKLVRDEDSLVYRAFNS